MEQITTIGLDLAKNVFQVHGVDAAGKVLVRKQLRRAEVLRFFAALPPCLVGIEACGTAHHWARELTQLGHTGSFDAASLRQALREARQDGCRRCRSDRRGGDPALSPSRPSTNNPC
jgi:transposase